MTMHLVHPGLTTLNTGKSKKKINVKQQRALAQHESWLKSQGLHPQQLAQRQDRRPKILVPAPVKKNTGLECSNGFAPGGAKKSVFDSRWTGRYDDDPSLAQREELALQQAEALKSRLAPLYNKGPIQVQTPGHDLKSGNGRGRN
jgi:hypothetical protein